MTKIKPISICLVTMGKKGLEMVKTYPENLPVELVNEITIKSMPLGAKDGDFTSNIISNDNAFSGYVFSIPSELGRSNIASLVAVFDDNNYNTNNVRKVFSVIINELKKKDTINIEVLSNILPNLFNGFQNNKVRIKISSIVTVEIDFEDNSFLDSKKDIAKSFSEDMW